MTRRNLIGAAMFGAAALGIAGLAAAAGYFGVLRDDDDDDDDEDEDEGRAANERNEKRQAPIPNSAPAQPPSGAPQ